MQSGTYRAVITARRCTTDCRLGERLGLAAGGTGGQPVPGGPDGARLGLPAGTWKPHPAHVRPSERRASGAVSGTAAARGQATHISLLVFDTGVFTGTDLLIRSDLYHGQPCRSSGDLYRFIARIGYYECLHQSQAG